MKAAGFASQAVIVAIVLVGFSGVIWSVDLGRDAAKADVLVCKVRNPRFAECAQFARESRVCRGGHLAENGAAFFNIDGCAYWEPARKKYRNVLYLSLAVLVFGVVLMAVTTYRRWVERRRDRAERNVI